MLGALGINHGGVTGAIASKIHPATYLAFSTLALLSSRGAIRPRSSLPGHASTGNARVPDRDLMLAAYIVLDGRKGIATIFDTYLLAISGGADRRRTRPARHCPGRKAHPRAAGRERGARARANMRSATGSFRSGSKALSSNGTCGSTGLSGHPLENAQMTGIYIMALLSGGGAEHAESAASGRGAACSSPRWCRSAAAPRMLLTLAMMALWMFRALCACCAAGACRSSRSRRWPFWFRPCRLRLRRSRPAVSSTCCSSVRRRGGSAKTRLEMFEIFSQLSAHDILIGASHDMIDSMRRSRGLELGIENPVVRLALYQGAIFTGFLIVGLVLFLIEIVRRLRPGYGMALIFFLVIVNSYESISNKTVGTRAVHRADDRDVPTPEPVRLPFGGGSRMQTKPATQPSQVST